MRVVSKVDFHRRHAKRCVDRRQCGAPRATPVVDSAKRAALLQIVGLYSRLSIRAWWVAGAGKFLGVGAAGEVYGADWGGLPIAIKVPAESCDVSYDEALSLLQHEEEVYRFLYRRLEGSAGAAGIDGHCCDTACRVGLAVVASMQALPRGRLRSDT